MNKRAIVLIIYCAMIGFAMALLNTVIRRRWPELGTIGRLEFIAVIAGLLGVAVAAVLKVFQKLFRKGKRSYRQSKTINK